MDPIYRDGMPSREFRPEMAEIGKLAPAGGPRRGISETKIPGRFRRTKWTAGIVGVIILAFIAGILIWVNIELSGIERSEELTPTDYADRPAAITNGSLNYLLIGNDKKPEDASSGRADTLMVLHINPARDQIYLVSIPRGVLVQLPSGPNRINASFQEGGAKLTVQTVEKLLGIRIDHVAMIDFEGFIGLTEALGGVTVDNPYESSSSGFHFPKGKITVSGKSALAFVRQRKGLANGDLARTERQRIVVKAIMSSMLSKSVLTDPVKLSGVIGKFDEFLTVDAGLNNLTIQSLALSMKVTSAESIHSLMIPVAEETLMANGSGSTVELVDEAQLAELVEALRSDSMPSYFAKYKNQVGFTKKK